MQCKSFNSARSGVSHKFEPVRSSPLLMLILANDLRHIVAPTCYAPGMCGRFTQHLSWKRFTGSG
jgi:hypothetical protein